MKPLIFSLLFFLAGGVFHQTPAQVQHAQVMVSELTDSLSRIYHVVRTIPDGFHLEHGDIYTWKMGYIWVRHSQEEPWKKSGRTGAVGVLLQSDDRQCEVLYDNPVGNPLVDTYPKALPGFYSEHNLFHRNAIISDLLSLSGGRDDIRFEDYVTVISGREARRRFNADSIFLIDIPIEPLERDGDVYTQCTRMYLSKRDRSMLGFVWFFTDDGYKRWQEYMDALEGHVAYKKGRWHKPDVIKRLEKAE